MPAIKRLLILLLLSLSHTISNAQVSFSGNEFPDEDFLRLKKTTTLFSFQYMDYKELENFEQALKKSWTITPYKIVQPQELFKYAGDSAYSYFYFDGFVSTAEDAKNVNVFYLLKLSKPESKTELVLGSIALYPDFISTELIKSIDNELMSKKNKRSKMLNLFYNESQFYNWSPGFLAGYLKQINEGLLSKGTQSPDYGFYNRKQLPKLATDTLYVPKYIRESFSSASARQPLNTTTEISEPYRYKLKFVSVHDLDSLILKSKDPIKYIVYTQQATNKIISIYNSENNQIIYQKYVPGSFNFEMSDLNEIRKIIVGIP